MSDDLDTFLAHLNAYESSLGPVRGWLYNHGFAGYNGLYWATHPHKLFTDLPFYVAGRVKRRRQRASRGWGNQDTWSLDYYLLSWLPDALEHMADTTPGYPGHGAASTPEAWDKILRDMASGLRSGFTLLNHDYDTPADGERLEAEYNAGWALFTEWFFHLWT